jgi:transcriptional regulator with XRE-family HTH domain
MLTQLELALRAEVSARHLSFVETGRSRPTSEMILRLARQLDVPLRERNVLLLSGGYAPAFPVNRLADPPMRAVHEAIEQVLRAHEPYPAVVIDARWELVAANDAVSMLTAGAAPALLEPPVNVLRLSLHPEGMAPRIVNLAEWRAHLLERLNRDIEATAAPVLIALRDELDAYPSPPPATRPDAPATTRPRHRAVAVQHDHRVRHAPRGDAVGTGHRVVLPGRRADGRVPPILRRPCAWRSAAGSRSPERTGVTPSGHRLRSTRGVPGCGCPAKRAEGIG